jgi:hypothetical protein
MTTPTPQSITPGVSAYGGEVPSPEMRAEALAVTFPSLRDKPGISPFNADMLDRWANSVASSGERLAARFVLSVYNADHAWKCGPFCPATAVGSWDIAHWRAFQAWAVRPFVL